MDWSSLVFSDGSIDWGAFAFTIGTNLLITAFAYLFVPVLLSILSKKYDSKKLKRINLINCIVVWLAFRIIQTSLGDDPSTGAAVFLWGAVGYGILKKHCLAPKQSVSTSSPTATQYTSRGSLWLFRLLHLLYWRTLRQRFQSPPTPSGARGTLSSLFDALALADGWIGTTVTSVFLPTA